ncbi:MAG: hypothetical protein RLZZ450_2349 [Pseudomonadota bacterium]|jgi:hypothetical protein
MLFIAAMDAVSPCSVRAQATPPPPKELDVEARPAAGGATSAAYRQFVDGALVEYGQGNYLEARALFYKAHSLFPNARTLRGLGITEFELRDYRECVRLLSEALNSNERPLSGPMRADTERLLARARDFFGSIRLRISPADASAVASVLLDDRSVPQSVRKTLSVDLGEHQLTVRAPGYETFRQTLQVVNSDQQDLSVRLTLLHSNDTSLPGPGGATRHDEPARTPLYKNGWLWTGVGLVAGAVVASVFLLRRDSQDRSSDPITTPNTPADGVIHVGLVGR